MTRPWTSLRRFLASARRGRTIARRPVRTRLHLEGLEDRIVPSNLYFDTSGLTAYGGGQSVTISANGTGYTFSASEPINVYGAGAAYVQGNGTNTVVTPFSALLQVDSVQNIQLNSNETSVFITDNSVVGEYISLGDPADNGVQNILAPVNVNTPAGDAALNIFDAGDYGTHQSATLSSGSLTNLAPAAITWSPTGLSQLYIDANSNIEDIFTVNSPGPFPTYLLPGNSSEVDVQSTSGTFSVYGDSTAIYVGSNAPFGGGTLAGIQGQVNAFGFPGRGPIYLSIDDSGDTTGQVATISRDGFGDDDLTGPATITWDPAALDATAISALNIYGGSGGNAFNIDNLDGSYHTYLDTGSGYNSVTVNANTSPLQLAGYGTTSLYVDGYNDSAAPNVTLASDSLTGLTGGQISWTPAQLAYLSIVGSNGGSNTYTVTGTGPYNTDLYTGGANTVNVQATTGQLALHAAQGGTTVNVGSAGSTRGINGAVNINSSTPDAVTLNVNDSADTTGRTVTMGPSSTAGLDVISGLAAAITYDVSNPSNISLGYLNVSAGSGGNTFSINANIPSIITTVNTGKGKDRVTLLQGNSALSLNDSGTNNTLVGPGYSTTWAISGANRGTLSDGTRFADFQNLVGGAGNNTFQFHTGGSVSGTITGGGGGNTLIGPNQATTWTISGVNSGKLGSIGFSKVQNLVGGTGVDTFKFSSTSAKVASINGGGGRDWLNYSALPSTSTVTVNLATGSATNVNGGAAGAVTNIQNVLGSATGTNNLTGDALGNILIGGSGLNTIVGGSGNSLLIGGSGHGSITGGSGEDILIAGTTTYNATTTAGENALMAILAELQSADTFAQKVYDIIHGNKTGGGSDLNGTNKLTWGGTSPTVKASSGAFTLSGDSSASAVADWFFSNSSSTVKDFNDDGVKDEHNNNAVGVF